MAVRQDDMWGYMNGEGTVMIDFQFDNIWATSGVHSGMYGYIFSEGFANVVVGGKWGFIDTSGIIVIPPMFDEARPFDGGVAAVRQDRLWGFINARGEMISDFQFDGTSFRIYDMIRVWNEEERATHYFNMTYGIIVRPDL